MVERLTKVQRRILCNIRDGHRFDHGRLPGMSSAGGWDRALASCYVHGWVNSRWIVDDIQLTEAGRAALTGPQR